LADFGEQFAIGALQGSNLPAKQFGSAARIFPGVEEPS
jgi:hypothetical protein